MTKEFGVVSCDAIAHVDLHVGGCARRLGNTCCRAANAVVNIKPGRGIKGSNGALELDRLWNNIVADTALDSTDGDDGGCECCINLSRDNSL